MSIVLPVKQPAHNFYMYTKYQAGGHTSTYIYCSLKGCEMSTPKLSSTEARNEAINLMILSCYGTISTLSIRSAIIIGKWGNFSTLLANKLCTLAWSFFFYSVMPLKWGSRSLYLIFQPSNKNYPVTCISSS